MSFRSRQYGKFEKGETRWGGGVDRNGFWGVEQVGYVLLVCWFIRWVRGGDGMVAE